MAAGVIVVCLAVVNPNKEIFLEMIEVELDLPTNQAIREIMKAEAQAQGIELTPAELAELQGFAGKNPLLARKTIRKHKLGLKQKPKHSQYINIAPIFSLVLVFFLILKFVGMGTRVRQWYIGGGIGVAMIATAFKLGSIKASQKRFGQ